uniref:Uncharacterized protein n=1 Tax=Acrobeloides nanus TaxID=290746 RepID=A0A914DU64_9BILA
MLQVLIYFGLNFLGFLVFYQIWKRLEKPEPYDYTTIPGLKCEDFLGTVSEIVIKPGQMTYERSRKDGNMGKIRELLDYRKFLDWLNQEFGPIASFYWGARYVIVVSELNLVKELRSYSAKRLKISSFAIGSILLGDPYFWNEENFRQFLYMDYLDIQKKYEDRGIKLMLEEAFQNRIFMEYPNSRKLLAIYKDEISQSTSTCLKYPEISSIERWSRPLVVVFNEEIELDAHPVPAYIPIVINMEILLENLDENEVEPFIRKYFSWLFTIVNET